MGNSSLTNLSGFNVGESNVYNGVRLMGQLREIAIEVNRADKKLRDKRLALHFNTTATNRGLT